MLFLTYSTNNFAWLKNTLFGTSTTGFEDRYLWKGAIEQVTRRELAHRERALTFKSKSRPWDYGPRNNVVLS